MTLTIGLTLNTKLSDGKRTSTKRVHLGQVSMSWEMADAVLDLANALAMAAEVVVIKWLACFKFTYIAVG